MKNIKFQIPRYIYGRVDTLVRVNVYYLYYEGKRGNYIFNSRFKPLMVKDEVLY